MDISSLLQNFSDLRPVGEAAVGQPSFVNVNKTCYIWAQNNGLFDAYSEAADKAVGDFDIAVKIAFTLSILSMVWALYLMHKRPDAINVLRPLLLLFASIAFLLLKFVL